MKIKDTVSAWVSKEQKTDNARLLQQKPDSPEMFLLFEGFLELRIETAFT